MLPSVSFAKSSHDPNNPTDAVEQHAALQISYATTSLSIMDTPTSFSFHDLPRWEL